MSHYSPGTPEDQDHLLSHNKTAIYPYADLGGIQMGSLQHFFDGDFSLARYFMFFEVENRHFSLLLQNTNTRKQMFISFIHSVSRRSAPPEEKGRADR
jgi:hypothetical protein